MYALLYIVAIVDLMCAYFATQIFRSFFFVFLSFCFGVFFSTFYFGLEAILSKRIGREWRLSISRKAGAIKHRPDLFRVPLVVFQSFSLHPIPSTNGFRSSATHHALGFFPSILDFNTRLNPHDNFLFS